VRISQVCIERPVLATVLSIVIALFGLLAFSRLPNRYLPNIDPPIVSITTILPGAAPEVVETSVTDPIEDQVNGIEGVKHVTSESREQVSLITVEFELGRDFEAAANDVRDRVARARSDLPQEVEDPVVAKQDSDARPVFWLALYGEGYDQIQLTTLAETKIVDRLASNEDLITYMNSAAGQRFLTATPMAPAPLDSHAMPVTAPINRILWSVQAGVILAVAGAGLFIAKSGVIDEAAQAMQVLGILVMALGFGFVLSALAAWALSRQFGLVHSRADHA